MIDIKRAESVPRATEFVDTEIVAPLIVAQRAVDSADARFVSDVAGGSATFGELHRESQRWASAFATAGISAGTAVASMMPNCVDHYAVWMGIGWLRALEVPINSELRGTVLHHVLEDAGAELLVIHESAAERLTQLDRALPKLRTVVVIGDPAVASDPRWQVIGYDDFLASGSEAVEEFVAPQAHDISSVLYTSGTTGPSKGVLVTWAQLHAGTIPTRKFGSGDGADCFYATGSPSHVVSKGAFVTMALTHGHLVVRPAFSLGEFWTDIARFGVKGTVLVGSMADFLLAAEPTSEDATTSLSTVLMAPVSPRYLEFNERFGTNVWTAYNMTEISVPFSSLGWVQENPQSCGRLRQDFPFYEARLVDEWDNEVGVGMVGELIVRTAVPWTLNAGYLHLPEATATAWRNGWFHTGDAFTVDADGQYFFVDRMKDTIRRRGENISSFEVEAEVRQHPLVVDCAAVAVPADELEDEIKVVVVADDEFEPSDLIAFLLDRVPRYMVPRYVEQVAELPKTQTLRVKKAELRKVQGAGTIWDRLDR